MKKFLLFLSISFSFLYALVFFNPYNEFNVSITVESSSDFAPIYELYKDNWKTLYKHPNTNIAYLNDRIEGKFHYKKFLFSIFQREDYFLLSNEETAEFVYQLMNNQVQEYKDYNDLYLKLKGFKSQGFNTTYLYDNENISTFIGMSIFKVLFFQDGYVEGKGIYAQDHYQYSAHSEYYYSKNFLYKTKVDAPKGYGYTFHFGIKYTKDNFQLIFLANDFYSKIYIKKAPYSNVYLNSDNKYIDKEGYVHYAPLLYGIETYKNYQSKYETKYLLKLQYDKYFIENERWFNKNFPYIGYSWNYLMFKYGFKFKNLDINLKRNWYFFNIGSNKINLKKASYLRIGCGVLFKF